MIKPIGPQDLKINKLGIIKILDGINFLAIEEYHKGKNAKEALYNFIIYMLKSPSLDYREIEKLEQSSIDEITQYLAKLLEVENEYKEYKKKHSIHDAFKEAYENSEIFRLPKKISDDFKNIAKDFYLRSVELSPKDNLPPIHHRALASEQSLLAKEQLLATKEQTDEIKKLGLKIDKNLHLNKNQSNAFSGSISEQELKAMTIPQFFQVLSIGGWIFLVTIVGGVAVISFKIGHYLASGKEKQSEIGNLSTDQLVIIRELAKYQVENNFNKVVISRDGFIFDDIKKKSTKINLIKRTLGDSAGEKDFEKLILSIPDTFLKHIPEARLDSPYVVTITDRGKKL